MKKYRILFLLLIVLSIWFFNSCSIFKTTDKNKYLIEKTLQGYYLTYLEPTNWYLEQDDSYGAMVLNYTKRIKAKKELSISIESRYERDVSKTSVQQDLTRRIPNIIEICSDSITEEFGAKAYVFRAELKSKNVDNLYITGILAYSKGLEYSIVLSNYHNPVEDDQELLQILKSIRITDSK